MSLVLVLCLNFGAVLLFYSGVLKGGLGFKIFSLLTVDFQSSLPTLFNTILVVIAFIVLAMISLHIRKMKSDEVYNWLLLTAAFLLLSLDENPSVHNIFVTVFNKYGVVGQRLVMNYAWGMPYGALVVIFVFFLIRFVNALPRDIAIGFVVSGFIYVFGAIVIGLYGANLLHIHDRYSIRYVLLASYEESLEMIGLTLFIYYLMRFIHIRFNSFSLEIK
ncbi:MAG TPA: hypothetical protein VFW11_24640 [Cyclobacteriaceae bacterium]|nr:hypothetical protein [Cyclobacteriaceae bacterium]